MATQTLVNSLPSPESRGPRDSSRVTRWPHAAPLIAFACVEAIALPLLLVLGRARWFYNDDWGFLAHRMHFGADALMHGYYGHWVTLPVIAYDAMWSLVGLHHYWPYQLLAVLAHLVVCALLLLVMRRAGVAPWIATLAACTLLFFGTGAEDILVAFQITFVGSLLFGLLDLLFLDVDGPLGRRDVIGLACGLGALMCSNVGVAMVVVVGVAALLRRGWRIAAFHTVPLGLIYAAWAVAFSGGLPGKHSSAGEDLRFVGVGVRALFTRLADVPGIGVGLVAMLVVGAWLLRGTADSRGVRQRVAVPVAMLFGVIVFLLTTGFIRANPASGGLGGSPDLARRSRYMYVAAALALPAIALAASAIARRWRGMTPVVVLLVLIGVPGNFAKLATFTAHDPGDTAGRVQWWRGYSHEILALARAPIAKRVPRGTVIANSQGMTIGWLLDATAADKVPGAKSITAREADTATLRLGLATRLRANHAQCHPLRGPEIRTFAVGASFSVATGKVSVAYLPNVGEESQAVLFNAPVSLRVDAVPLRLRIAPGRGRTLLCD